MRAMTVAYLTPSKEHSEQLHRIAAGLRIPVVRMESLSELEKFLREHEPGAVVTDCRLADGDWRDVMEICRSGASPLPVVVTDETDSASLWAEVSEAGASDLLARPFYPAEVRQCLTGLQELQNREQLAEATI